jgi:peptidoglycan/LPS O-acetylase OafA/YrhL
MTRTLPAGPGLPLPPVRNLPALTSLRAFAALFVFVFHLQRHGVGLEGVPVVPVGYTGVSFFFVLSGFVLAWTYRPGRPSQFWLRRVARVYPSHLVMLGVAALVPIVAGARSVSVAVPNAFLVHAFSTSADTVFAMNAVSWSLSCEIFFYAMFPLVFLVLSRVDRVWRWTIPAAMLGATCAALVLRPELGGLWFYWPPVRLAEFALGVAVACEVRSGLRLRWVRLAWVVPALLVTTAAVEVIIDTYPLPNQLLAVPYAGLIFAAAQTDLSGVGRVLSARPLVYAGEVSFAFYLVHELVIIHVEAHLQAPALHQTALILVVAVLAAIALHHAVERPLQRVIVRHGGAALIRLWGADRPARI